VVLFSPPDTETGMGPNSTAAAVTLPESGRATASQVLDLRPLEADDRATGGGPRVFLKGLHRIRDARLSFRGRTDRSDSSASAVPGLSHDGSRFEPRADSFG